VARLHLSWGSVQNQASHYCAYTTILSHCRHFARYGNPQVASLAPETFPLLPSACLLFDGLPIVHCRYQGRHIAPGPKFCAWCTRKPITTLPCAAHSWSRPLLRYERLLCTASRVCVHLLCRQK